MTSFSFSTCQKNRFGNSNDIIPVYKLRRKRGCLSSKYKAKLYAINSRTPVIFSEGTGRECIVITSCYFPTLQENVILHRFLNKLENSYDVITVYKPRRKQRCLSSDLSFIQGHKLYAHYLKGLHNNNFFHICFYHMNPHSFFCLHYMNPHSFFKTILY